MKPTSARPHIAAVLALATLGSLATASANAGGGITILRNSDALNPRVMQVNPNALVPIKLQFKCVVKGTPVEFPNDIAIWHSYSFTVPAGTKVAYTAPYGKTGTVVLPALPPNTYHFVNNVFPGGGPAGAPCTATQI